MGKFKAGMWVVIFLIVIASPTFTYFFLEDYLDSENYENRNIETKPNLSINNFETFPENYEKYYNDNIPFRNQLVRLNNSIDYFLFGQSSNIGVTIGKDNWLFYSNPTVNPIEQSLGYWNFTEEELQIIADNLVSAKNFLESQNIEFVLFIAPNKETIYMDKLPDYYQMKSRFTSTDQLIQFLQENTDIRLVYPKQELLKMRNENPELELYKKLDSHWNQVGGYVGARCLAKELGIEMPSLSEISLEPVLVSTGDLAKMLNITIKNASTEYNISGISTLETENEICDFNTKFVFHTPGADDRKLFVDKDSFSTALAPSLATQFEHSLWVHTRDFNRQQIIEYDTDIFVLEIVERFEKELLKFNVSP